MRHLLLAALLGAAAVPVRAQSPHPRYDSLTRALPASPGLLTYYYEPTGEQLLLDVPRDFGEFIYTNSLAAGVGSNDLGLDRGQLGATRLVAFERAGAKLLLVEPNLAYRADTDNPAERRSVEEAFAESVLWGFPVVASGPNSDLIDLAPFLLRDAHGVARRLEEEGQGEFELDPSRSAVYPERTRNFPRNTELEAVVTLTGRDEGDELRSVTPDAQAVTTRQHHSFVALPPPGYEPRAFDVRGGQFARTYADYASPIGAPVVQRYILRHRLQKREPAAAISEAVEPIVYYVDPGAPEPVRSALIEGASWWDEAFQAAGFAPGTFRVELLPEGADPLDVRYNVIQWVHRSTRGWSYGNSVADPRTGEILKGHVSLGSQRVRQDYLIAQGLIDAYDEAGQADPRLLEFALARLRQLSAHEVGHTLGLAHNFAASTDGRASVMDYPHPYVTLTERGEVDLSDAYDVGIGAWDERTIKYSYGVFPRGEADSLAAILRRNDELGFSFITDRESRPLGSAHPAGHLWDNGPDATAELRRVAEVRRAALRSFDERNLAPSRPLAELERVFVPLYLGHRYQVEACAKTVGGVRFTYAVNDGSAPRVEPVPADEQAAALTAVLGTLTPRFLRVPDEVLALLPPQPPGYERDRELFDSRTNEVFDPWAAAEASIDHTLALLLEPARVQRLFEQASRDDDAFSPRDLRRYLRRVTNQRYEDPLRAYANLVRTRIFAHSLALATHPEASAKVRAWAASLASNARYDVRGDLELRSYLELEYQRWRRTPSDYTPAPGARIPDGSPIGSPGTASCPEIR